MDSRRSSSRPLGRTQQLVLHLLASIERPPSARDLSYSWPSLSESAAMSAINRLAMRGLVDLGAGDWTRGRFSRTFVLTPKGAEAERALLPLDEDLDEAEAE